MWTKRRTPAARAAACTAAVPATCTAAKLWRPRSTMIPTRCIAASAPSAKGRRLGGSRTSPRTSSTPPAASQRARAGSRTSARTACPRRRRVSTRWRPTNPVAPVTATITGRGGARSLRLVGGALVEEHERVAPRHDRRQCFEDLGVEHRAGEVRHPLHGLLGRHLLLVGSGGAQGVVDLRHGDDASPQRDLLPPQAVGVAGTVPALVVAAHHGDDVLEVGKRREDLGPDAEALLDVLELLRRQRALLVEHHFAGADLPDVVQAPGHADVLHLLVAHAQLRGDGGGEIRHPSGVATPTCVATPLGWRISPP